MKILPAVAAALALVVAAAPHSFTAGGGSGAGGKGASMAADPAVRMIVPGGDAMKYWPFWRGPSGQGVVEGTGYPDTWSDTENVLWRVPVPGRGHSSPIVWGDRIFLTTAAANGTGRSVLCYRRADGKLVWERAVPEAPPEKLYPKNSYASSSVTTDGTLVYAYFGSAGVVAVDFDGKIAWHATFGPVNLYHGPGGSPMLYKDSLILYQEQRSMDRSVTTGPGFMVALDTKTGRERWRQARTPQPGWGTPIAIRVGDRDELIVSSSRRIEAFDPATGALLWHSTGNTAEVIPMPVVGHGLVYCVSGRAGPTFAVRPGGSGDVTATHVVWSTPKGSSFVPSPLLLGDYLYTVNDMAAIVSGHHAKTGELVGQFRLGEAKREGFSASPVAVGGKIYFTNDDGETFVLSPAPDFKLLHVNRIGEPTMASPALVDGRWYIRTAGHLLAIGRKTPGPSAALPQAAIQGTGTPAGMPVTRAERKIIRTPGATGPLPKAAPPAGSWPSFRGTQAAGVADGQHLPDRWNGTTGENILWKTPLPGLAHSSPVVWGDRVYVTTAVSSDPKATFRRGLYGDGDASTDRSRHRWLVMAFDARTGRAIWERVACEGEPLEKRHIKSTYASATPATDGRIVVAWFGSQGVYAYDVNGTLRWKVDLGRLDLGAYDLPTYEWGTASSPIIWKDLVILQVDTQADSFLLALNAATGETVWKTQRDELPSWGTPTVAETPAGPVLVTNASNLIRGYDAMTGKERWRLGGSSKITAPTPIASEDLLVIASGRGPERPIFVVKADARGDLTLPKGSTSSGTVLWSRTGRGSYMPTPLVYGGLLYVLGNNGVFDAYRFRTGADVYRQRLPVVGSGYSASPVAADGKLYLSGEDGDILVVAAGPEFTHLATNTMGEPLMATPALSSGAMYVRTSGTLFAIGRR